MQGISRARILPFTGENSEFFFQPLADFFRKPGALRFPESTLLFFKCLIRLPMFFYQLFAIKSFDGLRCPLTGYFLCWI